MEGKKQNRQYKQQKDEFMEEIEPTRIAESAKWIFGLKKKSCQAGLYKLDASQKVSI